ncbi:RNA polymerase sigma factor [Sulfidibacter corallicola]|uniref:RNA polymerase sigma factor n=1 Tax=Sulfidibacter corallicola TaxID=2818388 RepID=A0A8A4TWS9_SULCO|nr:RNA polymerase sigma factor [Sulfidibacter corallicola]QTD53651.1 RNA polymerase sigma factor [Sulfidibacter corallicola]
MADESFWIEQIKKGNTHFFRLLYQAHYKMVFRLCYRFTRDVAEAEEQLQEVFMKVLGKLDGFRGDSAFSSWLYRLTTNHMLNHQTRVRRHANTIALDESLQGHHHEEDPLMKAALARAIEQLPTGLRTVLILHDQEGLKHDDIAELLDISAGTSRSQLTRARMALRKKLEPLLRRKPSHPPSSARGCAPAARAKGGRP